MVICHDCITFVPKQQPISAKVSEKRNMKIAFLISAHTDAIHLKRLIEALPQSAYFYIHLDCKADMKVFKQTVINESPHSHEKKPHICFIKERYNIMWGSFGQVRYQMALLKRALQDMPDYFISISGLDYPLWPNETILAFIESHQHKNMLQAICLADHKEHARLYEEYRFFNEHFWPYHSLKSKFRASIRHIIRLLGFRKPLVVKTDKACRKLYKGGSWWGINRDLAQYVMSVWENEPSFAQYFHNSFGPDETFVHTIAFNSQYKDSCIESNPEHANLVDLSPLTHIDYRDQIKVFTETDFDELIASGKMFCRKVITGKSNQLMDLIDNYRKHSHP